MLRCVVICHVCHDMFVVATCRVMYMWGSAWGPPIGASCIESGPFPAGGSASGPPIWGVRGVPQGYGIYISINIY